MLLLTSSKSLLFDASILSGLPLFKGLQTSKPLFVFVLPGVALVPDFRFLEHWLLRTGNKFSNPKWLLRSKRRSNHQISLKGSLPDENIPEKNRLMTEDPNNLPSSLLGNAIDLR